MKIKDLKPGDHIRLVGTNFVYIVTIVDILNHIVECGGYRFTFEYLRNEFVYRDSSGWESLIDDEELRS